MNINTQVQTLESDDVLTKFVLWSFKDCLLIKNEWNLIDLNEIFVHFYKTF